MIAGTYSDFLSRKTQLGSNAGFEPLWMPDWLFDFQKLMGSWAIRRGRAALLEDCGLGKTPQELVWAENCVRKTNKPTLVACPLGVAAQMLREAEKFGIEANRSKDGKHGSGIVVTNYERLHHFNPDDFGAMACDEASCVKHFSGATQQAVTEFMRILPYRLMATATAAPNDFIELGTLSEALGELGYTDMITRFFKEDTVKDYLGWGRKTYRFRGHAERPFWQWVCSWARAMRKPSDYGFDDGQFILPPLKIVEHVIKASRPRGGMLFTMPAETLAEQREERRQTVEQRCQAVADMVKHTGKPFIVWCHLNEEGTLLDKLIPDALEVAGRHTDEEKESRLLAFTKGETRGLITKQKIAGWGLNWQHCSHVICFPSHSWEAYYQAIRRCYRFGQKKTVRVDIVTTEGEQRVTANLQRKADQADTMFRMLVEYMGKEVRIDRGIQYTETEKVPTWL
jgi:hypothetical protein